MTPSVLVFTLAEGSSRPDTLVVLDKACHLHRIPRTYSEPAAVAKGINFLRSMFSNRGVSIEMRLGSIVVESRAAVIAAS